MIGWAMSQMFMDDNAEKPISRIFGFRLKYFPSVSA